MAEHDVVVVDASVLAAAVFAESEAAEAADLLRDQRLFAPSLIWYEMSEVARTKSARRPEETAAIMVQFEMARRLPITLRSPDWPALPQLALDTGLTAYDAAYLSLSIALQAPLATFDARLKKAAQDRRL
jgi:predicted nucleic acid-binding protein